MQKFRNSLGLFLLSGSLMAMATDINSPNGNVKVSFNLTETGQPVYEMTFKGKPVVKESKMGFDLKNGEIGRAS